MTHNWYYTLNGQQQGPIAEESLAGMIAAGQVSRTALVWAEGMTEWQPASAIPELAMTGATADGRSGTPPPFIPPPIQSAPASRPTSVTVFAILNILFGAYGLICMPFTLIALLGGRASNGIMHELGSAYATWSLISSGVGFLAAGVLLALGIGLLQQKGWARKGSVGYGWYAIIMGMVSLVITITLITSHFSNIDDPAQKAGMIGGVIGGAIGGVVGMIYPILLIVFMQRPIARKSCNR